MLQGTSIRGKCMIMPTATICLETWGASSVVVVVVETCGTSVVRTVSVVVAEKWGTSSVVVADETCGTFHLVAVSTGVSTLGASGCGAGGAGAL